MSSSELLVMAAPQSSSRVVRAPLVVWPRLRVLLMLSICAFPAMLLYSLGMGRNAAVHSRSSAVVARVRISRAPSEFMLVRSPQPQPVAPKPVGAPVR